MYKIGEFSNLTNTSVRTLRYYDDIDLFKPDEVDLFTGYRYYSDIKIDELKLINLLKKVGFSLDEIKNNWDNFTDNIMLKKKQELINNIDLTNNKIKLLDNIRYSIFNGKIILGKINNEEKNMVKKLTSNQDFIKTVIKSTYDMYIYYNGESSKNSLIANEIKTGKSIYYLIYQNTEIIDDFIITNTSDRIARINIETWNKNCILDDEENFCIVIDKLKEEYNIIYILIPIEQKDKIKMFYKYGFIKDKEIEQTNYKYIKLYKNINKGGKNEI